MPLTLYAPERNPRLAYDKVSWDAIVCLAHGTWNENLWEMMDM